MQEFVTNVQNQQAIVYIKQWLGILAILLSMIGPGVLQHPFNVYKFHFVCNHRLRIFNRLFFVLSACHLFWGTVNSYCDLCTILTMLFLQLFSTFDIFIYLCVCGINTGLFQAKIHSENTNKPVWLACNALFFFTFSFSAAWSCSLLREKSKFMTQLPF